MAGGDSAVVRVEYPALGEGCWIETSWSGPVDGLWSGPRINLPAQQAWWARGVGPVTADGLQSLIGQTVTIHVDGRRQVYVLRSWHPDPEWPNEPSQGHFVAEWPD